MVNAIHGWPSVEIAFCVVYVGQSCEPTFPACWESVFIHVIHAAPCSVKGAERGRKEGRKEGW